MDSAEILKIQIEENEIKIVPKNSGIFQYSLEGINFQDTNRFTNIFGGIYTAYLSHLAGCKTISQEFAYILPEKVITPNGDGYHDFFSFKGLEFFGNSKIRIFDRYGKLLKSGGGRNFSWDGTFVDKNLPADDYWYEIEIEGFGVLKGHFTLMR